jgi:hypothetical protein
LESGEQKEAAMSTKISMSRKGSNGMRTQILAMSLAAAMLTASTATPASTLGSVYRAGSGSKSGAASLGAEDSRRIVMVPEVNRAQVESLQRWVAGGHEEWCKDARLVAAEELARVTPEFGGAAMELEQAAETDETGESDRVAFDWTTLEGRASYRVTVERFVWLAGIAAERESRVWVPTRVELRTQD